MHSVSLVELYKKLQLTEFSFYTISFEMHKPTKLKVTLHAEMTMPNLQ